MKILTSKQIQETDQHTIESEPIASIDLMERASLGFVDVFFNLISPKKTIAIVCGRGNNGGDGLAIARMLLQRRYEVEVYVIQLDKKASADFTTNLQRLEKLIEVISIENANQIPDFNHYDVVIDGIFGSGLSRPVEGLYANVIDHINKSGAQSIAIDISSGLYADRPNDNEHVIQAECTITFQVPKFTFFLPQNFKYVGEWHLVDIGLSQSFIENQNTNNFAITEALISPQFKLRNKFDHKGTWGRAMLMVGSYGKMGAAVLAAQAALRAGVGLLTIHSPSCGYHTLQTAIPEAMVSVDEGDHFLTTCPSIEKYDVIGIGPGIGKEQATVMSLLEMVRAFTKPILLDADALNIMSEHHEILDMLPAGSIITPHPKEFERLVGSFKDDFDRIAKQKLLAAKHNLIVVVKGAHTTIVLPTGEVYFNNNGNAGMASGGSGDVLSGIITALLAQGYEAKWAAIMGVYLHGAAGDVAAVQHGKTSMLPSDIINCMAPLIKMLE